MIVYPMRLFAKLSLINPVVTTFRYDSSLLERETYRGLKIIRVPYVFKVSKGFISPQSILVFINELSKADRVIVSVPNFEALPLVLLAKIFGKKVTVIFHCEIQFNGGLYKKIIGFFLNSSVHIQLLLSEAIVACPDYIESLRIYGKFKSKIIKAMPIIEKPSIDEKKYKFLKSKKGDEIWLGIAGRISEEKGIERLINVLKLPAWDGKKARIVFAGVAGVGEEKYFRHIEELMINYNVPYTFLGKVTDSEMGAFYKSLDVLVFSSVTSTESFGMVQAEAMLLGAPVVSSDIPGVRLCVKLTGMGLLVNVENESEFSNGLKKVIENRKKFSNQILLKRAEEVFNNKNTLNVFRDLLIS